MLIGPGEEEDIPPAEPLKARYRVRSDRLIGMTDVRASVGIADCGGDIERFSHLPVWVPAPRASRQARRRRFEGRARAVSHSRPGSAPFPTSEAPRQAARRGDLSLPARSTKVHVAETPHSVAGPPSMQEPGQARGAWPH